MALDPSLKQIPFFYQVLLRPGHLLDKIKELFFFPPLFSLFVSVVKANPFCKWV